MVDRPSVPWDGSTRSDMQLGYCLISLRGSDWWLQVGASIGSRGSCSLDALRGKRYLGHELDVCGLIGGRGVGLRGFEHRGFGMADSAASELLRSTSEQISERIRWSGAEPEKQTQSIVSGVN